MNVIAIIQARMGSTRLPCKTLLSLHGAPVIDWVVNRTRLAKKVQQVVVATSTEANNDPLAYHLHRTGTAVFCGSEQDVLGRFYEAATQAKATHVVRICADNPLIWGPEIDALIDAYLARQDQGCDYAYNHIPRGNEYPDGLGAELVSFALLEHLHKKATLPAHREHCLSYIWDNKEQFAIHTFSPADKTLHRPDVRLDMDTQEDYRRLATMPLTQAMPPHEIIALYDNWR